MNPYYQFAVSFAHTDTTLPTPPEVLMPPNITPAVPPIGAIVLFTEADGSLFEGVVQSLAYKVSTDITQVVITAAPVPPTPKKRKKRTTPI